MPAGKYQKWLTPDGLMLLRAWARDGLTDIPLAKKMGISASTLYEWKKRYPEISEALARGKDPVDVEVENALHGLCVGYRVEVRKTFKVKRTYFDDRGRRCEAEVLATGVDEVYIPPNVNAQKFWLANRRPDAWRERREVEAGEDLSRALEGAARILGGIESAIG